MKTAAATIAEWQDRAERLVKVEMARRGVGYSSLVDRLRRIDVHIGQHVLSNRISRGQFSAAFLLQVLRALGVENVYLGD
jgi:hypothetical protein